MKKLIKNIGKYLGILLLAILFCSCQIDNKKEKSLDIVVTNFPCYDFIRAITKYNDNVNITMLLKPGMESHSYDPTPKDIIKIQNADVFAYVGGESDAWAEKIINSINEDKNENKNENENITETENEEETINEENKKSLKVLKMSDYVTMIPEEFKEEMTGEVSEHSDEENTENEIEYDEHVWTSPKNAIKIINGFNTKIKEIDFSNATIYDKGTNEYIKQIKELDKQIKSVLEKSQRKEIIFADRFPIIYFTKAYGLEYYAAFPGCSSQCDVNPKTLAYLIDKVKEDKINYVFHIELSNENVAKMITKETNTESLLFHTVHNVSKDDFKNGETYITLMTKNIENLEKALN